MTIKNHILVFLCLAICFSFCSENDNNNVIDNNLNLLLENKSYFKLKEQLYKNEDKLSEDRALYYKAFVTKVFGQTNQSNAYIDLLLSNYKNKFNDTILQKLLEFKATNCIYNHQYKAASEIYNTILKDYKTIIDSSAIADYENAKNLFGTFSNIRPQLIQHHNDVNISSYRNKFNHLMVPVKSNNINEEFVFDTGANLSTISESQAKKMNLLLFEQSIKVGSATTINVQSKLAVADSFYLGDILFKNVIFLVMPDSQLTFPEIRYKINGIIGFPVIHQLDEIQLHKDGSITVPRTAKNKNLQNLALDDLTPVIKIITKNDTLLFTFDTGATTSELSLKYFNEHKKNIQANTKIQTSQRGGAGGKTDVQEYMLNNFNFNMGSKQTTLAKIPVILEEYSFNKYFDGNLGQDVFTQFNTLIINFKYMYVDVE